jgi:hypothetical protein
MYSDIAPCIMGIGGGYNCDILQNRQVEKQGNMILSSCIIPAKKVNTIL